MIEYRVRTVPDFTALGQLRTAAWNGPDDGQSWPAVLARSLTWVTAHEGERLVGFVNVAWDGGAHAFLLDTTVHPDVRRRGVGLRLVRAAAGSARQGGAYWLHVDFEPHLRDFYVACGFRSTDAGLLRLA
ncbi:GNAT family N-acetyltransferase [Deinococcus hopiensis]|uniref:Predicted P-loop ATPase fused to an acetyltransferase n=1 Tax=Deinococcus hopiensis KR-140 TaxID=695939 RepID=A0A1W1VSM0_9DEIO|nr:GNAT family N-acetyltransferase [Deinococcus hopiensis]SMB95874.1 Predicted P-loop ATPase fused to an acetyltransferase [Deinococcus hopiensis KR-140]